MKGMYITSIDDVLKWLNVIYDRNLPDPEIVAERVWYRAVLPENTSSMSIADSNEMPEIATYRKEMFAKERIMLEGKPLWVWVKQ